MTAVVGAATGVAAAVVVAAATGVGSLLTDGHLLLAGLVALAAGAISFASPCVLPLVPGFLGYVTGLTGSGTGTRGRGRPRVMAGAALFVVGFSTVFLTGTLLASAVGVVLAEHRRTLSVIGGLVVIAMASVFLGVGSQSSWSPSWRPAAGLAGAPLLGMVFAIGWAPCMGPTLAVIYTLATTTVGDTGTVTRGAVLGAAYCLGLGLPFLAAAAGLSRMAQASAWLRRHHQLIRFLGGGLLLLVGILLITGLWDELVVWVQTRLMGGIVLPL